MTSQTARRAAQVGRAHQHLGHDAEQALREEALGLLALLGRQRVDDAVDRLDRARRVQRAEHEVARLRSGHGPAHGVRVAQFAHEDHVRVLAHRGPHALGEGGQVRVQLALDHLRQLAAMDELDRVLEAHDVEAAGRVQQVDHRRERRRLAGAGRARHEHHALVVVAELADHRRQVQRIERGHVGRDRTEHGPDARILAEHVDAEPVAFLGDVREVDVVALAELLLVRRCQDLGDVALELGLGEVAELDRQQLAVHAQHRRHADRQVHVRAALRGAELQECVDSCQGRGLRCISRARRAIRPWTGTGATCRRTSP